jgi:hypothetical protein
MPQLRANGYFFSAGAAGAGVAGAGVVVGALDCGAGV